MQKKHSNELAVGGRFQADCSSLDEEHFAGALSLPVNLLALDEGALLEILRLLHDHFPWHSAEEVMLEEVELLVDFPQL